MSIINASWDERLREQKRAKEFRERIDERVFVKPPEESNFIKAFALADTVASSLSIEVKYTDIPINERYCGMPQIDED